MGAFPGLVLDRVFLKYESQIRTIQMLTNSTLSLEVMMVLESWLFSV